MTPFSIEPAAVSLQPDEATTLSVSFDPTYRDDLVSHTARQRCLISYPDNPQKDFLDLSGVIEYPNLVFADSSSSIDFGCILLDSIKRVAVPVTNAGSRPVRYSWSWVKQTNPDVLDGGQAITAGGHHE